MPKVRALVITAFDGPPEVRQLDPPDVTPGRSILRLLAGGLNPVDLAIGSGRFYMPVPDPPFVAGGEAVAEVVSSSRFPAGARVWALQQTGSFAEVFSCPDDALVPVPDGVDPAVAVGMGIAGLAGWMSVHNRGEIRGGETVLVLGAGGVVGQVAVQAARAGGAGRIVAAMRNVAGADRARDLGAHAVVALGGADDADRLADACAEGANLVIDTLWGDPMVAALRALAPRARIVQVGNGAGPVVAFPAGPLRGGRIDIRGFSVFNERHADLAAAFDDLARAAGAGDVIVAHETVPLAEGPAAWARQAAGTGGTKLVLVP